MTTEQLDGLIVKHLSEFAAIGPFRASLLHFVETGRASGSFRSALHEMMRDAARIEPMTTEWISVKERLPKESTHVLAYYGTKYPVRAYIYRGEWVLFYYNGAEKADPTDIVTHWQPLPPPPIEPTGNTGELRDPNYQYHIEKGLSEEEKELIFGVPEIAASDGLPCPPYCPKDEL